LSLFRMMLLSFLNAPLPGNPPRDRIERPLTRPFDAYPPFFTPSSSLKRMLPFPPQTPPPLHRLRGVPFHQRGFSGLFVTPPFSERRFNRCPENHPFSRNFAINTPFFLPSTVVLAPPPFSTFWTHPMRPLHSKSSFCMSL